MKGFQCSVLFLLFIGASITRADESDFSLYSATKLILYSQTSALTPSEQANPWVLSVLVTPTSATSVLNPTFDSPTASGLSLVYNPTDGVWGSWTQFATQGALDAGYSNGAYTFHVPTTTAPATTFDAAVNVAGDIYPAEIPTLSNLSWTGGVLVLNTEVDNTIGWNNFASAGGLFNSILLSIGGVSYNLLSSDTSVLIPGGTLASGQYYSGDLYFGNFSDFNGTVSGVPGVAGYYARTSFTVFAVPEPSACEAVLVGVMLLCGLSGSHSRRQ